MRPYEQRFPHVTVRFGKHVPPKRTPRPRVVPLAEQIEVAKLAALGWRRLASQTDDHAQRARFLHYATQKEAYAARLQIILHGRQEPGELFDSEDSARP